MRFASQFLAFTALLLCPTALLAQTVYQVAGRPDRIIVREGQASIERSINAAGDPRDIVRPVTPAGTGFCIVEFQRSLLQAVSAVDGQARFMFRDNGFPPPAVNASQDWARIYTSSNGRIFMGLVYYEQRGVVYFMNKMCNALGNGLISVNFVRN